MVSDQDAADALNAKRAKKKPTTPAPVRTAGTASKTNSEDDIKKKKKKRGANALGGYLLGSSINKSGKLGKTTPLSSGSILNT